MINSFGNKLAFNLFTYGEGKGLDSKHIKRAKHLLDIMDAVDNLEDLKSIGFPPNIRLHRLKGELKGLWAIDIFKVSGLRITFKFVEVFEEVKIEDYHK